MIIIENENDEDSIGHKGMQQTVKAKVVNLLKEKLETQDVSNESSDMNGSEHSYELFCFLHKTRNNFCRNSATKIFGFVDLKSQW